MNKKLLPRLTWSILLLCLSLSAQAFDAFVVQDIQVDGLKRHDIARVSRAMNLNVGDRVDEERVQQMTRDLFKTGYFSDVAFSQNGGTLVVRVVERPSIARFTVTGNKEIPADKLLQGLRDVGLAEGRAFDRSVLEQVEQELRRQYFANGRYGVKIDTQVNEETDNRVAVAITIDEGEVATIRRINVVGNDAFSDEELLKPLRARSASWWRLFGSRDRYSQQTFSGDLETLTSFYQDRGYLNFRVESTQVSLSPDKESIYLTVNVYEGPKFQVSDVALLGQLVLPESQLRPLVTIRSGTTFSRQQATESAKKIAERLGDEGYAFAQVEPMTDIDEANRQVKVNLVVKPGNRYYVRNVNFRGNTTTQDQALRREMRQYEGASFAASEVARSRVRLARLPFIEQADVQARPVAGESDLVDVDFDVTERSAGAFQVGVGYSSGQGVLLNANVSHSNWFGTGNRVSLDFVTSEYSRNYSASLTQPFYTLDGVSRTISLFQRSTDSLTRVSSRFDTDTWGGSLRYGIPITEYDSIRLGGSFRATQLTVLEGSTPQQIIDFVDQNGDSFNALTFDTGWVRDTRNRTVFANKGYIHRLFADIAVPVVDLEYYKLTYDYEQYFPINRHLIGSARLGVGYADSYGETTDLPPYEKFFAGGIQSVRGYQGSSLGTRDEYNNPLGGNFRTIGQFELLFPTLLGESRNTRFSLFLDAGNVFDNYEDFDAGTLRTSTGVGFQWLTPILGLLEFAVAYPLNDEPGDDTEVFSFTFGATF
ncbi:outer membrane protein assembly factor BamA [Pseudoxanthomonas sp.]|uniref:outer membrane protein assembly factor BamA n=1 Tax=Pseudoxanthomonas sp. TaxID=1871049 RepID=UPI0025E0A4D5|nr:outer membrane protein assembly factor BamA [Pseudoxanthomonas sp.]